MLAIKNGELIDERDAVIPVTSSYVQYSYSVYEVVKLIDSKPVFLADHIERLKRSANDIGLALSFTDEELTSWVYKLIESGGYSDGRLRIFVQGGLDLVYITHMAKMAVPALSSEEGVDCTLYFGERFLPQAKTGNLLMSYIALNEAHERDCYEALLVNRDNRILEGTKSNFYALLDGVIYTADDTSVLSGITREHVLRAAAELGLRVVFEAPKYDDIQYYDGVFLSSTSVVILPIRRVGKQEMKRTAWPLIEKLKKRVTEME